MNRVPFRAPAVRGFLVKRCSAYRRNPRTTASGSLVGSLHGHALASLDSDMLSVESAEQLRLSDKRRMGPDRVRACWMRTTGLSPDCPDQPRSAEKPEPSRQTLASALSCSVFGCPGLVDTWTPEPPHTRRLPDEASDRQG